MADTGLQSPSANGDDYTGWTSSPENVYTSDDARAHPGGAGARQHDYYNFGFSIPAGATIDGIEVVFEWLRAVGTTADVGIELSHDGGTSYTSSSKNLTTTSASDTTDTAGGAADTWGRAWSVSEFTNANFRVRITNNEGGGRPDIDHLEVRVTYTEASGNIVVLRRRIEG